MKNRKQAPKDALAGMLMGEAMARLLKTDPVELADVIDRAKIRQGEIRKNVDDARKEIERGVRPAGKKFRL